MKVELYTRTAAGVHVGLFLACRYVVLKIQAAVRGEAQPEKASTTACSQAKGGFGTSDTRVQMNDA